MLKPCTSRLGYVKLQELSSLSKIFNDIFNKFKKKNFAKIKKLSDNKVIFKTCNNDLEDNTLICY